MCSQTHTESRFGKSLHKADWHKRPKDFVAIEKQVLWLRSLADRRICSVPLRHATSRKADIGASNAIRRRSPSCEYALAHWCWPSPRRSVAERQRGRSVPAHSARAVSSRAETTPPECGTPVSQAPGPTRAASNSPTCCMPSHPLTRGRGSAPKRIREGHQSQPPATPVRRPSRDCNLQHFPESRNTDHGRQSNGEIFSPCPAT
mmetsp:Transcript_81849/g.207982  ORF Transcript_81849/g.207982 Transcript_81849/m.207982 type:complete len:204 (-) Transcript_81849:1127-1738(-)